MKNCQHFPGPSWERIFTLFGRVSPSNNAIQVSHTPPALLLWWQDPLPFWLLLLGELAGGPIEDHTESFPSTPSTDFASELQPSGSVGTSSIFVVGRWDWHGIVVHGWLHGRQDFGAVDGEASHPSRNTQSVCRRRK